MVWRCKGKSDFNARMHSYDILRQQAEQEALKARLLAEYATLKEENARLRTRYRRLKALKAKLERRRLRKLRHPGRARAGQDLIIASTEE